VVGTASGNFVEIQTAERRPFTQPQLLELLALVAGAIESTNL
jgi:ribonuclease PH